ncbi:MAG: zf-HC2 domain-containing protein [Fusicatenibacter sp.]
MHFHSSPCCPSVKSHRNSSKCSVVRDILPLYLENMVSEETGAFIKDHLENCPECTVELETMKAGTVVSAVR